MIYQDLVIKNGKLVGKFDEMYQTFEDPWEQSIRENFSYEKTIGLDIIKNNNLNTILELGCGHGHYTNKIKNVSKNAIGVDISETAIKKAKMNYPDCEFIVSDITNINLYNNIDCIMMVEITWYVLEKLSEFKKIISKYKGLSFFHTLNTYPPNVQKYGVEYFTNNEEIMNYFSDIIHIEEYGSLYKNKNDGSVRNFFYGKIK
jgi:ubiquinone/menaquinone biosynthesis C-methylase UbiE